MKTKKLTAADLPRLMTPAQVADAIGVSEGTLRNWRMSGRGPAYLKVGANRVMYLPEDITQWLSEQRVTTAATA